MRYKGLLLSISPSIVLIQLVHRTVEPELFSCLRKYGISFYAFSPRTHFPCSIATHEPEPFDLVAGGFFTGRYISQDDQAEAGSRFDPGRIQGKVSSTSLLYLLFRANFVLRSSIVTGKLHSRIGSFAFDTVQVLE